MRKRLGNVIADTIILEANFHLAADTSMPDAAAVVISIAEQLYGQGVADQVAAAFQERGLHP